MLIIFKFLYGSTPNPTPEEISLIFIQMQMCILRGGKGILLNRRKKREKKDGEEVQLITTQQML